MKKIVFFVESMHCGGAERSLLSLLNNIDVTKYQIDLLVIKSGGEFEKFIPTGIAYKSIHLKFSLLDRIRFFIKKKRYKNYHKAQIFWESVEKSHKAYPQEYDVAIAWGQGFATYYVSKKIRAIKKYAWINIDYDKAGYKFDLDKDKYAAFDKIVGVSEFVRDAMKKYVHESKLLCIRNIIDREDILVRATEPIKEITNCSCLNIVSIGRLAKQKAFHLSILAAKHLLEKHVNFKWYIVGEGAERDSLLNLIKEKGLTGYVELLGFRDNPYPYIAKGDIYVQTSLFEGLGRTLIEAAILCKPIVSTNFPTAYELVEDGQTGFVTEMNAEAIAEKILLLHMDKKRYHQMVDRLSMKTDNEKQNTLEKVYTLLDDQV